MGQFFPATLAHSVKLKTSVIGNYVNLGLSGPRSFCLTHTHTFAKRAKRVLRDGIVNFSSFFLFFFLLASAISVPPSTGIYIGNQKTFIGVRSRKTPVPRHVTARQLPCAWRMNLFRLLVVYAGTGISQSKTPHQKCCLFLSFGIQKSACHQQLCNQPGLNSDTPNLLMFAIRSCLFPSWQCLLVFWFTLINCNSDPIQALFTHSFSSS